MYSCTSCTGRKTVTVPCVSAFFQDIMAPQQKNAELKIRWNFGFSHTDADFEDILHK